MTDESLNNDHGSTEQSKTRFHCSVPLCNGSAKKSIEVFPKPDSVLEYASISLKVIKGMPDGSLDAAKEEKFI